MKNNLMDMYLIFTEKKIKKYIRMVYGPIYNEEIVSEYIKTYINARYYNIRNTDKPARAFYLRILDELDFKKDILIKRNEVETEDREERAFNLKFINNLKEVFSYILFFDGVRKIENFKNIKSLKDIVQKMISEVKDEFGIKLAKNIEDVLNKEVTSDLLEKEIFFDKFETDEFVIDLETFEEKENVYLAKLDHNVKMPLQYSSAAIEKVFTEGIVAEDKLQVEYILLSLISVRDIINGEFDDMYIAEFTESLFKKKTKLDGILTLLDNQALQEKISLNIYYSDYIKNSRTILDYTNKGYNFVITLDNTITGVEDVERLKMFKIVVAPRNLVLYKELKQNKAILSNVIYK